METYSKSLAPSDYAWIEKQYVERAWHAMDGLGRRLDHRHREWEWALVLKAIRHVHAQTVLDIGGGGSVFTPAACLMGCEVTQVDLADNSECVRQHSERAAAHAVNWETQAPEHYPIRFVQGDFVSTLSQETFDAVCAISVIEHVEQDDQFFCKMCEAVAPSGILAVTTDFHESGKPRTDLHLRTYNGASLTRLQEIAESFGFTLLGGRTKWLNSGTSVNGYNFASLIMQRVAT